MLDLLFNISLVIDSVIKFKNPSDYRFSDHILFASKRIDLKLSNQILKNLNGAFINDFNTTLTALLSNSYQGSEKEPLTDLSSAYAIAYGIRNHGAHNVTSAPAIWQFFPEIEVSIFSMLFNVIENLY